MKITRHIMAGTMLAAIAVATAAPALASVGPYHQGHIGYRETVCAQTLQLRSGPNDGANDGQLVYGQTFLVKSRANGEVYGFAYGNINRNGWVNDGWFCNH